MVTFATNFTVSLKIDGIPGKTRLIAAHGSGIVDPHSSTIKPGEIIDGRAVLEVPTLAFADRQSIDSTAGGGAFLIELEMEK